jgi:hypothetical protein
MTCYCWQLWFHESQQFPGRSYARQVRTNTSYLQTYQEKMQAFNCHTSYAGNSQKDLSIFDPKFDLICRHFFKSSKYTKESPHLLTGRESTPETSFLKIHLSQWIMPI